MKRTEILDQVLSLDRLPVRPETAAHLLAHYRDLDDNFRLRRLLAADPALLVLTARICGCSARTPSLDDLARTARSSLFWAELARQMGVLHVERQYQPDLVHTWRFGMATATVARSLVPQGRHDEGSRAFVAGWFRAIGPYTLALLQPEAWHELRRTAADYAHLLELERDAFGLNHDELAIHLLTHWGLSIDGLVDTTRPTNGHRPLALARITADAVSLVEQGPFALCPGAAAKEEGPEMGWIERAVWHAERFLCDARRTRGHDSDWLHNGARLAAEALAARCANRWRQPLAELASVPIDRFPEAFVQAAADILAAQAGATAVVILSQPGQSFIGAAVEGEAARVRRLPRSITDLTTARTALTHTRLVPEEGWIERPLSDQGDWFAAAFVDRRARFGLVELDAICQQLAATVQAGYERLRGEQHRRETAVALHEVQAGLAALVEERVMEAVAEFAAGAAHELNNRVAVIAGRAQLVMDQVESSEVRAALEKIVQETHRIREVLQKLYDLAQPAEPEYERVPVAEVLEEAVGRLERELQVDRKRIAVSSCDELRVQADPEMLREVLYELLRNALEAGEGPVTVGVRRTGRRGVLIRIQDRGPGMDSRLQRLAWIPFFSGRDAGRGTGLGLPLARRLVEAQGGRIRLYSCGSGTVVDIILPEAGEAELDRRCA